MGSIGAQAGERTAQEPVLVRAHVIPAQAIRPQVLSVDFFRSFLDDPYLLGRISVLHALSDLSAMGSKPLGVQAIITLPYGSSTAPGRHSTST